MDTKPLSKGAQHIEELLQNLPENSSRYRVLASAKRFKSSWVELGQNLAHVSNSGEFTEWGYTSFEDYCSKEIRIRRQTAEKLLLAFRFLERREPGLLQKQEGRPLPDYRSIDLLRQAEEEQQFRPDDYASLRATVIEEERSHAAVAKQYRDMVQTYQPDEQEAQSCRTALSAARRLSTSLEKLEDLPSDLHEAVQQLILYLEGRLESKAVS